jgi:hypothetical protein
MSQTPGYGPSPLLPAYRTLRTLTALEQFRRRYFNEPLPPGDQSDALAYALAALHAPPATPEQQENEAMRRRWMP